MDQRANVSRPQIVKPAKLLVVDDKLANLVVLEAVLDGDTYELMYAHSGTEALAMLKQHEDIALILLDVQMPGMDGFEVAKRIKAMPDRCDIPIIFITAVHTDDPFIIKGYQAGALDYFTKPFNPEILKQKVKIYTSFRQKMELLGERDREIKESEKLLQTSRKLKVVLESRPAAVIITDIAGKISQANEEGLRLLKSFEQTEDNPRGEFMGLRADKGTLLVEIESPLIRALNGQSSQKTIVHLPCFDGSSKSASVSASPLRGRDGRIEGAVAIIQDITDQQTIQDVLERRIHRLVSSSAEFG